MDFTALVDLSFKISIGLLTLTIAGLSLGIAYRQFKTAHDNLRLSLYERRYKVYRGLMDLLGSVSDASALGRFYKRTDQKRFLFKDDIVDYLREVREKVGEAQRLDLRIREMPHLTDDDRNALIERRVELDSWFDNQIEEAQMRFKPYLAFYQKL